MFIAHPALLRREHHSRIVRLSAGNSVPCVFKLHTRLTAVLICAALQTQSGTARFAFVALLLLALPLVLTFHVLYALPRFADRRRQF